MYLVVGLGNPGREYADNRHNIGFMVADEICRRFRVGPMRTRFGGEVGAGELQGEKVVILKPMEYMNVSGWPAQRAAAFFQIEPATIVVIHDDIDLDFGRVKLKVGGGHGGHNGLRSMNEQVGPDYVRVRAGIGHPGPKERVIGHVLGAFTAEEQAELPLLIQKCADAVESIVKEGPVAALNTFYHSRSPDEGGTKPEGRRKGPEETTDKAVAKTSDKAVTKTTDKAVAKTADKAVAKAAVRVMDPAIEKAIDAAIRKALKGSPRD